MSTPQILDHDVAYAHVHQQVYQPVFFEKLAQDYGIKPRNDQECVQMLTMAAQLRDAHEAVEKQASHSSLTSAQSHLDQQLQAMGLQPASNGVDQIARRTKEAAAQASFDPQLAQAVLSLQALAAGLDKTKVA